MGFGESLLLRWGSFRGCFLGIGSGDARGEGAALNHISPKP